MSNPIDGKRILLGVTGSIACYKAADLASKLCQCGALVDVILTTSALQFIAPLTFESVTGRRAYTEKDLWGGEGHVLHIGLAHAADLLVIAPASANTLAKLAHGLADNLLTVTVLAARCALLAAPAMDGGMFANPATQANIDTLRRRGVTILGPVQGHLASGMQGIGRMMEPVDLLGHIRLELGKSGLLHGRKIIVTAGGTQEAIDPVRFITNRSSGKQGFALAQAALDMGADVTLIAGNTSLSAPTGASRVDVGSAEEMQAAVLAALPGSDALLMAAAVSDFKPMRIATQKIKKQAGAPTIELGLAPDILAAVENYRTQRGFPLITVGFAAESQELLENARVKLTSKKLDLIVANDISARDAGFAVDENRVTLLDATGGVEPMPLMSKMGVADVVLQRTASMLAALR
jgi:phosphopantothenoylcysteine decarboxylase/phosphopantothenate--cysteine ligase